MSSDDIEVLKYDIFKDIVTELEDNLNIVISDLLKIKSATGHLTITRPSGSLTAYPTSKVYGNYVLYDDDDENAVVEARITAEYGESFNEPNYGKFWWAFHVRKLFINGEPINRPISFIPVEVVQNNANFVTKPMDGMSRLRIEFKSVIP